MTLALARACQWCSFVAYLGLFTFGLVSWLGPKKQDFLIQINCSQIKLANFVNPSLQVCHKLGLNLMISGSKIEVIKNLILQKNWLFFNEKKSERLKWFLTKKIHFESQKWHFLMTGQWMDSQIQWFNWLKWILGQKSCFVVPSQLARQKVNIH